MQIPQNLKEAIEAQTSTVKAEVLRRCTQELTERYKKPVHAAPFIATPLQQLAYLNSRFPATFAALCKVFTTLFEHYSPAQITSFLDLGSGMGTGMWALQQFALPLLSKLTLIEKDRELIAMGKALALHAEENLLQQAIWKEEDLKNSVLQKHDLVLMSYSFGEIAREFWPGLIQQLWSATNQVLVIVEPGTPAGYERISYIRSALLQQGAHLIAPCPHSATCPMAEQDWCHFAARVQRSSSHRFAKEGHLNYEDEKFSYIAFSKAACGSLQGDLAIPHGQLHHPQHWIRGGR